MNQIFEACCRNDGRGLKWHIGKVTFHLDGSLIALTSDSIPLVYLLGSKGGSGKTRAAMEYISTSDCYGTRFRQHEIVIHDQMEFHERFEDQKNGEFGELPTDQPQTRDCTCAAVFDMFKELAQNVTTYGGGGFHCNTYLLEALIDVCLKLLPKKSKFIGKIRHVLDVRKSLAAAGEMTNSVQMLMDKFCGFANQIASFSRNKLWRDDLFSGWRKRCQRFSATTKRRNSKRF